MRLLLDSHVLLWLLTDSLPPKDAHRLADERNELLISAVSVWELEVKRVKGTLVAPDDMLPRAENAGFRFIDLTPDNALDAARLLRHHGDPFDRLLVAQAQGEAATLVTADEALAAYDVPVMPIGVRR
ncbi:MAG: type II toxin-antitoxin system VapC family toxin [Conexibacter sp.]